MVLRPWAEILHWRQRSGRQSLLASSAQLTPPSPALEQHQHSRTPEQRRHCSPSVCTGGHQQLQHWFLGKPGQTLNKPPPSPRNKVSLNPYQHKTQNARSPTRKHLLQRSVEQGTDNAVLPLGFILFFNLIRTRPTLNYTLTHTIRLLQKLYHKSPLRRWPNRACSPQTFSLRSVLSAQKPAGTRSNRYQSAIYSRST